MITIPIRLLDPVCLPQRKTAGAACFDLVAREDTRLRSSGFVAVPAGVELQIPEGWEGLVRGRSGLVLREDLVVHRGTIDSDFRGEVQVLMLVWPRVGIYQVSRGDRIAQLAIRRAPRVELQVVGALGPTERGAGGFGSTGV